MIFLGVIQHLVLRSQLLSHQELAVGFTYEIYENIFSHNLTLTRQLGAINQISDFEVGEKYF